MGVNGSHLICKKHEKEKRYCCVEMEWICPICEIDKAGLK